MFAAVISIVIALIGALSYFVLPTARFPEIAPPNISVSATYTGGNAETVARTVATPLENRINGSPGMIYLQSSSTNDGQVSINATFKVGYNLDAATADVLTRVNRATPDLPQSVQRQGVEIRRSSRQLLAIVALHGSTSSDYDELFLSNYAETQIIPELRRGVGVGRVRDLSSKRFAMRIWLDPAKLEALRIDPQAVLKVVQAQNADLAAGSLGKQPMADGAAPAFTVQLTAEGRLKTTEEFGDIVVRAQPDGAVVRIRDIGHVELGSEVYGVRSGFSGGPAAAILIYQTPGANAVEVMDGVRATMEKLAKRFPVGVSYDIASDRTTFVSAALHEVLITLAIAIALVVIVTYLFLQSWRATLIPTIAIPVSLLGTFAPLEAFGFSLNTLSLLGLVLAVGLVVDDAIVVVENVERQLEEGKAPAEAARAAMAEVTGPIVATTIVLLALFVPVAFIPGITGQLYEQFALTIAFSVGFSALVSLTLTPALCAILLRVPDEDAKEHRARWVRALRKPLDWIDAGLARGGRALGRAVGWFGRHAWVMGLAFAALMVATVALFETRPSDFVPEEDEGYFYAVVDLPPGASVVRTQAVVDRVEKRLLGELAVLNAVTVSGDNNVSDVTAPYYGFVVPTLKPWDDRKETAAAIMARLQPEFDRYTDARVRLVNPPSLPGLGTHGGLTLEIEDRAGGDTDALLKTADSFLQKVRALPEVDTAEPTTQGGVPQLKLGIDRVKAEQLGVSVDSLFSNLSLLVGSTYANLFNRFGRTYQVYLQADGPDRRTEADLAALTVPNDRGEPVRVGSLIHPRFTTGPTQVSHYNVYPAVETAVSPSNSSGAALAAIQALADRELPADYAIEWSDVAYQQQKTGGYTPIIFALGVVLVFLTLAAQYESWMLPAVIVLTVPLAGLGALGFLALRGLSLDVYGQIGLLMLVGLAAKNSILIVAFARDRLLDGADRLEAAKAAAKLRMRPIIMTSLAFILGTLPLAIATGAGANSRISIGTTIVGGMLVATVLSLFMTPTFFVVADRWRGGTGGKDEMPEKCGDGGEGRAAGGDA
ncbi:efflux RND transporter permease subunit [Lichenibacterium dinghuense]|uniref:efflux RND transporter permease subunit n=1 Tax=Lichenibacterium dinghuense TaxID=2895977 RepID=UPI001F2AB07B